MALRDEEALGISERKILRSILGGIQVNGSRRRRSNLELHKIYKQSDIVKFVKLQRPKWAGHLAKMNEDRCCKKFFLAKPMGNRTPGRPSLRWIDCVEKDLDIFKVKKLPKVEMLGKNFWRRSGPTQRYRTIEEEEY
ncbi:putative endonuclease-reverse transcriptase [Trichonephila clavipes]|uniref:Putative endonuclease-reverse transcriptase n=1 Tax=Trichonephila clavipes TaxID=2585209 RepID=A0A8X6RX08_TRICX|nr:putative endonuclease-reverse transcriptase [Trichonephila clavipes]